ncbi:hypothetical protein BKA63DRAFT_274579 [Paraphoma chrysanthemicola]|nr:hypothetical protein BKA63DRAFT_274579 [Paraphoma chrysanthemicola]
MSAAQAANPTEAQPAQQDEDKIVRLHITPLKPDLLKVYLAPSILPLAKNISYHSVETFPEKGYGYLDLPESEAQKLKKKLNGTTLRGAKVRIEMAKSEKRKAREEADAAKDREEAERPSKRAKKEKRKKEDGVLEGVVLENERKVKRGWTEPLSKSKKDRKEKKDKDQKHEQKKSKYTKEPEMLFKAKLTPVAATEVSRKEKKSDKKEKKEKRSKSKEVVVHEFEKNTKTPSFLKETKVATEKKPAVEYVNGQGWVDEDGNVVEPETGKARNRRVLELVDRPVEPEKKKSATPPVSSSPVTKASKKKAKVTPPPESEDEDESSVVSSSSEDSSSESEAESSDAESAPSTPAPAVNGVKETADSQVTPNGDKEVHPLEALFKRAKPTPGPLSISTPKKLTPITTSFNFFDGDANAENMEVDQVGQVVDNAPTTPFTERDLEWRGLRSAAPTPDTAAIGRRFSFDWRKGSQEDADEEEDEDTGDAEADQQLSKNTKANAKANAANNKLPGVAEEEEDEDAEAGAKEAGADEKPESEFRKWFWENRGDLNRAWKKRRRDALKSKRHAENKKMTPHRRVG